MAAKIESEFQADVELIEGRAGVFDVAVDAQPIFSKHEVGRFPTNDEIATLISEHCAKH